MILDHFRCNFLHILSKNIAVLMSIMLKLSLFSAKLFVRRINLLPGCNFPNYVRSVLNKRLMTKKCCRILLK